MKGTIILSEYRKHKRKRYVRVTPASRATAAFVLGILSIVFCCVPIMLVGSVVGLVLNGESERIGYHKLQLPAKILCIIGTVLCSLAIIAIIIIAVALGVLS